MHPRLLLSTIGFALIGLASTLPDAPAPAAPQVVDMGNGKTLPIDAARLDAIDAVNESIGHSYNQANTTCLQQIVRILTPLIELGRLVADIYVTLQKDQITNSFDQSLAGDELSPKLMHCLGQEIVKPIGSYNSTTGNVR